MRRIANPTDVPHAAASRAGGTEEHAPDATPFREQFARLFQAQYPRLLRYLDRRSGEPELAADLAQETFIRLFRRNALPDRPEAWLITVALNLFRNARSGETRHGRLLSVGRGMAVHSDPPTAPDRHASDEARQRVRVALQQLPEREQNLLLLRAEGFSYRDIAHALQLNEASVGTLIARARDAFRQAWEAGDAS